MVAEWFYTEQGQRRGPVTWQQLQQLATAGQVKPNDLVWKNGMAQWVPASSQAGLFGAPAAPPPAPPAPAPPPAPPPERGAPPSAPSRPAPAASNPPTSPAAPPKKPPSSPAPASPPPGAPSNAASTPAPAPPARAGMSAGFKIAILAGGAGIVFLVLCCGLVGAIWWFSQSNEKSWKLESGKTEMWSLKFKKDENVEIIATAKADTDLQLMVYKTKAVADAVKGGNKAEELPIAVAMSTNSKECKLTFPAPETQDYYVILVNTGKETSEGKLVYKSTPK
jgi:hypothetical protein